MQALLNSWYRIRLSARGCNGFGRCLDDGVVIGPSGFELTSEQIDWLSAPGAQGEDSKTSGTDSTEHPEKRFHCLNLVGQLVQIQFDAAQGLAGGGLAKKLMGNLL